VCAHGSRPTVGRRAIEPPKGDGAMLLPAKAEVARQLRRYRAWERAMLAAPADHAARATFEDAGYTLCVLMGKRCAREAAEAAERYLRVPLAAYLQEQNERPRATSPARRGPPASRPRYPAGR
jgi:hypothetical protein